MKDGQYDRLRRMLNEIKEFGGLTGVEIGGRTGVDQATISRFIAKKRKKLSYENGAAITALYEQCRPKIRAAKEKKVKAIMASLRSPSL